jgi:hypothetical protein
MNKLMHVSLVNGQEWLLFMFTLKQKLQSLYIQTHILNLHLKLYWGSLGIFKHVKPSRGIVVRLKAYQSTLRNLKLSRGISRHLQAF